MIRSRRRGGWRPAEAERAEACRAAGRLTTAAYIVLRQPTIRVGPDGRRDRHDDRERSTDYVQEFALSPCSS